MLLKRYYKTPPGWVKILNTRDDETGKLRDPKWSEGVCINYPPLDYIKVLHANPHKQNFSTGIVERGIKEGWMMVGKDRIVLDVRPEPLVYTIDRGPGHYCVHCWAKQEGEREARIHVASEHRGVPSPDKESPSGYCRINAYLCTRKGSEEVDKDHISWFRRIFGGG